MLSSEPSPAIVLGTVRFTSGLNSESTLLKLFLLTLIFSFPIMGDSLFHY